MAPGCSCLFTGAWKVFATKIIWVGGRGTVCGVIRALLNMDRAVMVSHEHLLRPGCVAQCADMKSEAAQEQVK